MESELKCFSAYQSPVLSAVADDSAFVRLSATGVVHGETNQWTKATIRIVEIRDELHWQFTFYDGKKTDVKNFSAAQLDSAIAELLATPFSNIHIQSVHEDLHLRISKRGKALLSRGKPSAQARPASRQHNRSKLYPIPEEGSEELWMAIDIMDTNGRIKPTRRDKFLQVNEFIKILKTSIDSGENQSVPLHLIDCGCGNAYLTFAAYHYLTAIENRDVRFVGIDANAELIGHCSQLRDELKWEHIDFAVSAIAEHIPATRPDIVLSLHACDTATDEAIAQAVLWESTTILAAPCCQHELREQIESALFAPVIRHGILKQRTADILTDACRAQILSILGYKTDVIEFIDSAHTPKNLMIRAQKTTPGGNLTAIEEYKNLVEFWHIQPALARYLKPVLEPIIGS